MNKRENLLSLLKKQGYETVPYEFSLCPSLIESYRDNESTTMDYMEYFNMPWKRLPDLIPDNIDKSCFLSYHMKDNVTLDELDEWGIGHRATATSMHMTKMYYPLDEVEDIEDIEAYTLPTYSQKNNSNLKQNVEELHRNGIASVGNMQCTIWETSWYIRGMENLMVDMMVEEEMAEAILEKVTLMSITRAELYAHAGVDILFLGDDIGMQQSIMMSEKLYAKWIQPRLKKVIEAAKKINPEIIVFYHSCGFIEPLIPYLIEAGIDVLNPIQPECMDFEEIFKKYGDRISFNGTIGTQTTMPFGTPEEVKAQVKRHLDIAGEKGGLFVSPTHLLEPEVPWENIKAYMQACKDYK